MLSRLVVPLLLLLLVACDETTTQHIAGAPENEAPQVLIGSAEACGPVFRLDAANSFDPEGQPLSFDWTLDTAPVGSALKATFQHVDRPAVSLRPDVYGEYVFRLRVSDGSKQTQSGQIRIFHTSGNAGAIANCQGNQIFEGNVRQARVAARVGQPVVLDGRVPAEPTAVYHWQLLDSPRGSNPALADADQAQAQLTADAGGDYRVALDVTVAGKPIAAAVVSVRASSLGVVALGYRTVQVELVKGGDKVALLDQEGTLHLRDLVTGVDQEVALPAKGQVFAVSPSGAYLIVAQANYLSRVNIATGAVTNNHPLSALGSPSTQPVLDMLMVDDSTAFIAYSGATDNSIRILRTGATLSLVSAVSYLSTPSNYGYPLPGFLDRLEGSELMLNFGGSVQRVSLKPDLTFGTSAGWSLPCYNTVVLSMNLFISCNTVYAPAGGSTTVVSGFFAETWNSSHGLTASADGAVLYVTGRRSPPYDVIPSPSVEIVDATTYLSVGYIDLPVVPDHAGQYVPAQAVEVLSSTQHPLIVVGSVDYYSDSHVLMY